ncbi:MAG: hypothetical protein MK052_09045 [Alphaproteobacteria bacterium]|nr:hypothetical protein [Alphaproteobacteria bacterium]
MKTKYALMAICCILGISTLGAHALHAAEPPTKPNESVTGKQVADEAVAAEMLLDMQNFPEQQGMTFGEAMYALPNMWPVDIQYPYDFDIIESTPPKKYSSSFTVRIDNHHIKLNISKYPTEYKKQLAASILQRAKQEEGDMHGMVYSLTLLAETKDIAEMIMRDIEDIKVPEKTQAFGSYLAILLTERYPSLVTYALPVLKDDYDDHISDSSYWIRRLRFKEILSPQESLELYSSLIANSTPKAKMDISVDLVRLGIYEPRLIGDIHTVFQQNNMASAHHESLLLAYEQNDHQQIQSLLRGQLNRSYKESMASLHIFTEILLKEPDKISAYGALLEDFFAMEAGIRVESLYRALLGAAHKDESVWQQAGKHLQFGFYSKRPPRMRGTDLMVSSLGEMAKQNAAFSQYMLETFFLNPDEATKYDKDALKELLQAFPHEQVATIAATKMSDPRHFPDTPAKTHSTTQSSEIGLLINAFDNLGEYERQEYFSKKLAEYLKNQKEESLLPFIDHALSMETPNTRIFVHTKLAHVIQALPETFKTFYPILAKAREDESVLVRKNLVKQIALLYRKLKNADGKMALLELNNVFPAEIRAFFKHESRVAKRLGYVMKPKSLNETKEILHSARYPGQITYEMLHADMDNFPVVAHAALSLIREHSIAEYDSGLRNALATLFNGNLSEWPLFVSALEPTIKSPYPDAQNLLYYSFVCQVRGTEGEDLLRRLRLEERSVQLNAFIDKILANAIVYDTDSSNPDVPEACKVARMGYSETSFENKPFYVIADSYFPLNPSGPPN